MECHTIRADDFLKRHIEGLEESMRLGVSSKLSSSNFDIKKKECNSDVSEEIIALKKW